MAIKRNATLIRNGKAAKQKQPKVTPVAGCPVKCPDYPGTFAGQTVYLRGKEFICMGATEPDTNGDIARFPIFRTRWDSCYTWDGKRWNQDHRRDVPA